MHTLCTQGGRGVKKGRKLAHVLCTQSLWDKFPFMDSMQESLLTWGLCSVFHDLTCHSLRVIYGANQVKPIPSKFSKYASIYYQLQVLHGKKLLYGNQCNENFTVSLIHTAPPSFFFY